METHAIHNNTRREVPTMVSSREIVASMREACSKSHTPAMHDHVRKTRGVMHSMLIEVGKNLRTMLGLSLRTSIKIVALIFTALMFLLCYCALSPMMWVSKHDLG